MSFSDYNNPPISAYSLDGNNDPSLFVPESSANNTLPVTFYYSPELADTQHTLNITVVSNNVNFLLDYILVGSTTTEDSAATPVGSGSASHIQPTIVTTIVAAPTSAAENTSSGSSLAVGPIVGGVVGGVALLVSAFLAFYFLYWKRRHGHGRPYYYHSTSPGDALESGKYLDLLDSQTTLTKLPPETYESKPFSHSSDPPHPQPTYSDLPYPPSSAAELSRPTFVAPSVVSSARYNTADNYEPVVLYPLGSAGPISVGEYSASSASRSTRTSAFRIANPSSRAEHVEGTAAVPLTPAERKATEAGLRSKPEDVQQHSDSGYRFDSGGESSSSGLISSQVPAESPPVYSES